MSIGSQELLEYSEATRTEISCPMEFWNYPFDTQFCNFILEPLHFDFQLVNSDMISSSQFESQNIKMSYDIEIIPLPPELAVRQQPEVGLSLGSWWQLFCQVALALLQAIHPDRSNFDTKTVGFTYKLTRKYSNTSTIFQGKIPFLSKLRPTIIAALLVLLSSPWLKLNDNNVGMLLVHKKTWICFVPSLGNIWFTKFTFLSWILLFHISSCSCLCVVSSWGSFLINPKVLS